MVRVGIGVVDVGGVADALTVGGLLGDVDWFEAIQVGGGDGGY